MTQLSDAPVIFHLSINVSDMDRSVDFFSRVLNAGPEKHHPDYAKFALRNPPLTLSLEPMDPREHGVLNHVGFRFRDANALVAVQRRIEAAGIRSEREEGVECCYSRQTKFWLHDPDGTLWEMYTLEGDIAHRGAGQSAEAVQGTNRDVLPAMTTAAPDGPNAEVPRRWSHRLGSPLAIPESHAEESLDEVALQGSFNGPETEDQITPFLTQAAALLTAGGRLSLHCLTADRPVDDLPQLPGPASVVRSVPTVDRLLDAFTAAGLGTIRLTTYRPRPCFTVGEAELRETRIEAIKPAVTTTERVPVVLHGPFAEITLDSGDVLRRGRLTELPRDVVDSLTATPAGALIVVLEPATSPTSCAT